MFFCEKSIFFLGGQRAYIWEKSKNKDVMESKMYYKKKRRNTIIKGVVLWEMHLKIVKQKLI